MDGLKGEIVCRSGVSPSAVDLVFSAIVDAGYEVVRAKMYRLETKTCKECGATKSIDDFNRNAKARDGHYSICRACDNAISRAWYAKNSKYHYQRKRAAEASKRKASKRVAA